MFADKSLGAWSLFGGASVIALVALGYWGGIPYGTSESAWWLQVALLTLIVVAFALVGWHLLLRPLPAGVRAPARHDLPVKTRQGLALLLTGGIVALVFGALWDELWHRLYGIPFGEDFFWRPHILIYCGFVAAIAAGFWALRILNRDLRGSFQQRFRANPLLGLLILNAAFMLYALPADPIWHAIIGEDLTAWSVPHLILLLSVVLTQMLALALHCSTLPKLAWRNLLQLRGRDILPLVGLTALLMQLLQLMLIDWDAWLTGIDPAMLGLYRPEWLLAACLVGCAALAGIVAVRVTRCIGAATAVGLLALAARWSFIQALDAQVLQIVACVAALLPLLAIDIYAHICAHRQKGMTWQGAALALILSMLPNALVIRGLYPLQPGDNLAYGLAVVIVAGFAAWISSQIAAALSDEAAPAAKPERLRLRASLGFGGGVAVFLLLFIATATPPV